MHPELHMDPANLDLSRVLVDQEGIRHVNPQRFEMEQLSAIVLIDREQQIIVGYKDLRPDEFWTRGHMPDHPLLPGVLMCEAAAQLCSYYTITQGIVRGGLVGFGGMENVRLRSAVRPGDRLVLVAKVTRLHHRQTIFNVQAFVATTLVFHADIIGVPINR
jgi:3-hydroxyacyl-[acyl-carrier-protein] dehydratase